MATSLLAAASPLIDPLLIIPFALLLLLIAVMPLTPHRAKHFWEHYYPHIAIGLGLAVAAYYFLRLDAGAIVAHTLHEYFSFIALIGSLFIVAGGIHIKVSGEATPLGNVVFLALGSIAANLIGTTGASVVLIRPFMRMNQHHLRPYHVVFFIFTVSNCGGALTPIGDPPLFLGYLRGVPFFWLIEHVLPVWAGTMAAILGVFFAIDYWHVRKLPPRERAAMAEPDTWQFSGLGNVLLLLVIIVGVFLPGDYFLREIVMLGAAAASYWHTSHDVHARNEFTFAPIKEVGFLFAGIFLTMMPALGYLQQHGREFGITQPSQYYFATGGLSAVLDNAPTYLNFLQLAEATFADASAVSETAAHEASAAGVAVLDERAAVRALLEQHPALVVAISLGAVFFGAMTYIGNGPNFMVKSIAESAGVKVPTFFGYLLRFSLPILLPILIAVGWILARS